MAKTKSSKSVDVTQAVERLRRRVAAGIIYGDGPDDRIHASGLEDDGRRINAVYATLARRGLVELVKEGDASKWYAVRDAVMAGVQPVHCNLVNIWEGRQESPYSGSPPRLSGPYVPIGQPWNLILSPGEAKHLVARDDVSYFLVDEWQIQSRQHRIDKEHLATPGHGKAFVDLGMFGELAARCPLTTSRYVVAVSSPELVEHVDRRRFDAMIAYHAPRQLRKWLRSRLGMSEEDVALVAEGFSDGGPFFGPSEKPHPPEEWRKAMQHLQRRYSDKVVEYQRKLAALLNVDHAVLDWPKFIEEYREALLKAVRKGLDKVDETEAAGDAGADDDGR